MIRPGTGAALVLFATGLLAGCAGQPATEPTMSYPRVEPVGKAERAMGCDQLAEQLTSADAIRRSVVHDYGPGAFRAQKRAGTEVMLGVMSLVPVVNLAMIAAALPLAAVHPDWMDDGSALAAVTAYQQAEKRMLELVRLRQQAACAPAYPGEAATVEADLLTRIPQLEADAKARRLAPDEYARARVAAFDQLRPELPPSVPASEQAAAQPTQAPSPLESPPAQPSPEPPSP